jgi:nucleotidyltransferase/DNA polymerase involved in DNA repair
MIVHLDADAFFASVEQAADVRLRGKPVAVGGLKRGVVTSASYEARRLGIYTAMPTAKARKLCPSLITVSGDFERYEKFSRLMFSYAYDHTPVVEVASIDEGYFDLKGNYKRSAREVAELIRTAIRQSLKISVSEGIARNKLVSAVASKLKKPSCFIEIRDGREREFLFPLENKWLPGVGPAMAKTLNQAGLVRIGQIAEVSPQQLSLFAGKGARQLWEFARGIDDRLVIPEAPAAKSWSSQETFTEDVTNEDWVLAKLRSITDRLFGKVRAEGKTVRTIEVRLRYNDFDDCRRSESLEEPTDLETDCYSVLSRLLKKAWQRRVSLRLVSVKLSGVYGVIFQCGLPLLNAGFDSAQRQRLSPILDRIKGRYGNSAIMRGHDLFLQTYGQERQAAPLAPKKRSQPVKLEWAALNCKSAFSFMDSLLKPEALVKLASLHGCKAVAMTDANLHGAVEFFIAARDESIKPIIAAEVMADGKLFVAYVKDVTGYQNLCAALSQPSRALGVGQREGLILRPAGWLPEVRYADPSERPMFNILQSIRTLSLLDERNLQKRKGHFHFPFPEELAPHSDALRDSLEIAEQCNFKFDLGGLRFPRYYPADGSTTHNFLRRLTMDGVQRRYGQKPRMLPQVLSQIEEELGIIGEVGYEEYFLLTWEILEDCKAKGIQWITRGSAADSLVCYCLGISDLCPIRFELYFRRFLNRDRMVLNKLPDIDIDFAHDRKDDVVDLIFKKYGDHAAIVGGFSTYRGKSAFADIAHWERGKSYESMRDFYIRTTPSIDEMDHLMRTGAFDAFGQSRTEQFWQFKELAQGPAIAGQGLLLAGGEKPTLPDIPLEEPSLIERLKSEQDILGFPVTDHPLALFPEVRWDSYCPIIKLNDNHGKRVSIAGMIIEDRIHRQEDGRPMKFISVCDATGIIECELFADVYRRFGIETVRNPVVEIVGKVMPFANGNGHTLQVQRVGKARSVS